MEPGQTGQQLRATAEEEVSQQQPHLCSLQHLQQEDHEYYPVGRQCGELLVLEIFSKIQIAVMKFLLSVVRFVVGY